MALLLIDFFGDLRDKGDEEIDGLLRSIGVFYFLLESIFIFPRDLSFALQVTSSLGVESQDFVTPLAADRLKFETSVDIF